MGAHFNPPPGWPPAPDGFRPEPGWQPDPSWPPAPPGWPLWIDDGQPGTSRWAIASFVGGLLGFTIVGAAVGIASGVRALTRIRRTGQRGKGLVVAGLTFAGFWILMLGVVLGIAAVSMTSSGSSGSSRTPVAAGTRRVGVFALVTGDCFDNPPRTKAVTSVQVMPCTLAHNAQVYARFNLHGSRFAYPGLAKVGRLAAAGCNARIGVILDRPKLPKGTGIRLLFPLVGSWLLGRRTVSCVIVSPTPDLTSSVLRVQAATG